jgi:hypothetical protein
VPGLRLGHDGRAGLAALPPLLLLLRVVRRAAWAAQVDNRAAALAADDEREAARQRHRRGGGARQQQVGLQLDAVGAGRAGRHAVQPVQQRMRQSMLRAAVAVDGGQRPSGQHRRRRLERPVRQHGAGAIGVAPTATSC